MTDEQQPGQPEANRQGGGVERSGKRGPGRSAVLLGPILLALLAGVLVSLAIIFL